MSKETVWTSPAPTISIRTERLHVKDGDLQFSILAVWNKIIDDTDDTENVVNHQNIFNWIQKLIISKSFFNSYASWFQHFISQKKVVIKSKSENWTESRQPWNFFGSRSKIPWGMKDEGVDIILYVRARTNITSYICTSSRLSKLHQIVEMNINTIDPIQLIVPHIFCTHSS